jgi:hypothetical protein
MPEGLLGKSKLAQHAYEESHNLCWKEATVLQVEEAQRIRPRVIRTVNPAWTSLPSGLPLLQQKSEN